MTLFGRAAGLLAVHIGLILNSVAHARDEVVNPASIEKPSPVGSTEPKPDVIQNCLDEMRIADFCRSGKISARLKKLKCPGNGVLPADPSKPAENPFQFEPANARDLPVNNCLQGGPALAGMRRSLQRQIERCKSDPALKKQTEFQFGCRKFTREQWCTQTNEQMLDVAMQADSYSQFMNAVRGKFDWYRSKGALKDGAAFKKGQVQFTAYNAPKVSARATPQPGDVAIYSQPKDLVHINDEDSANCGIDPISDLPRKWCKRNSDGSYVPYPDRKDLPKTLGGHGLEIAYLSPVAAYLLQVQGSGTIVMDDGTRKRVSYSGQNGGTRHLVGRVIKCAGGTLEGQDGIRKYFAAHPEQTYRFLNYDNAYAFFSAGAADSEVKGSDSVALTAMNSIATDRSVIPSGAIALFNVKPPDRDGEPCNGMAVAQDTGGAITGAHVDLYLGQGEIGDMAGGVNSGGTLFIAVPKGSGMPAPGCPSNH